MPSATGFAKFFTRKKTNVLYVAMPAYGFLLILLLDVFDVYRGYGVLNPAILIMLYLEVGLRATAKISVDYLGALLLLAISNMIFWTPLARYVAIPLLDRVFYAKKKGR